MPLKAYLSLADPHRILIHLHKIEALNRRENFFRGMI